MADLIFGALVTALDLRAWPRVVVWIMLALAAVSVVLIAQYLLALPAEGGS